MQIRCSRKAATGTTMVEVLMAIFVFAVMSVSLMGSFSYGFFVMQLVRENQRATQIMLEKIETIRLYSWDQVLTPGFIPSSFQDVYDPQKPEGAQGITYNGVVKLNPYPYNTSYAADLRKLEITITWTTIRNYTRTRSFSTFISKDGLQNYVY
jgi:type II secretory pathway pseudopilin PulG